jgi:drug/metabolite transporter (DMT)-like permease/regulator of protease activity HflC (stomatin/prohibitin superfamily)
MSLRPQLLVLGAMFAFSLMALFTRAADASILGIAAWRAVFVAAVFGVWAFVSEGGARALKPDRTTLKLGAVLGVCLAVASATFVGGYALTTVANTIFLHNLAPLAVFPLAWWAFRERPGAAVLTGGAVAVVGVGLLSGVSLFQVSHFASSRFLAGDALALLSAVGYAGVLVVTRKTRVEGTPILGTLFVAWSLAAVVLVGVALAAGRLTIPWSSVGWVLGLAVVCTNLPFFLLNLGMRDVSAGRASVLSLSEVIFASALGLFFFGESLAPVGWLGGVLAAAGVLYAVTQTGSGHAVTTHHGPRRWLRLGLWLAVLNVGGVGALVLGWSGGALLAWTALVALARLGPAALAFRGARGLALLVAVLACCGLALRPLDAGGGLALALVSGLALLADRALASDDTDSGGSLHAALAAIVAAELFLSFGHPAAAWASYAGGAVVGLAALLVGVASIRGGLPADPLTGRLRGVAVAALVLFAVGGVRAVPAGHVAVVERLGFPLETPADAGLSVRLPPPFERTTLVDVGRVRRSDMRLGAPVLAGDESLVELDATLVWSVEDAHAFTFGAADPDALLTSLARSAVVQAVGQVSLDDVLTTGREALEEAVRAQTQAAADAAGMGVSVQSVRLGLVRVPAPVMASFLDVISAEEDRQTRVHLADAYAATVLPQARGAGLTRLADAEATGGWRVAEATGFAARVDAIGEASNSPLTRLRLEIESVERSHADAHIVIAPDDVRVWTGAAWTEPLTLESP